VGVPISTTEPSERSAALVVGRRRFPRVAVTRDFHGQAVNLRVPLLVRELSREGFSVESAMEFPLGSEELFRFAHRGSTEIEIRARCVHVVAGETTAGQRRFVGGFRALPSSFLELAHLVESLERAHKTGAEANGNTLTQATTPGASRRRGPRFEVTGSIAVTVGDDRNPTQLRDIGLGGFALESSEPFVARERHSVHFSSGMGLDARILAEVVHAREIIDPAGHRTWLTGFSYVVDSPAAHDAVESVLDQATSCLSFLL
jgi:hypothetical protein